jgi:hypothetical protein
MAKRVRGSSTRPRREVNRRPATPASRAAATRARRARRPLPTRAAARAAELEAQLLAEERGRGVLPALAGANRDRPRGTGSPDQPQRLEYAYVARDLKDIVRIATLLLSSCSRCTS